MLLKLKLLKRVENLREVFRTIMSDEFVNDSSSSSRLPGCVRCGCYTQHSQRALDAGWRTVMVPLGCVPGEKASTAGNQ